ncbi:hypothetical protein Pogu_2095 [Pyrobaculum oguniense TE7]|uniref:Uncharacterized protein n=1 Tax=Pyrobaculum oguniense (strain DSM 13380 / JCM 10595 / TE7) TaxID=698757 RepID=H6QCS6_PYROT|nr:hypothetical protein Pogu_2095 [Pyrobaculum oguniense TE7]
MSWLKDVLRAAEVVRTGKFKAVTHGGVAHVDDTLAAALLHRAGAEDLYRLNTAEEIARLDGDVVVFDIGDYFQLPERFVVLDHHGVSDPSEEPSSVIQVALAVGARPSPLVATLVHWVDLYDRYGSEVKKWAGPYGNSINHGVVKYFGDATPAGLVKDTKFLELLAEAFYSRSEFDLRDFAEAYKIAEKLSFTDMAERYPRTFQTLRLMLAASKDPIAAATGREAQETGFGLDFGAYALLAVPELERYVLEGLERHFAEARRAVEVVSQGRYWKVVSDCLVAFAVEDYVAPTPLWNALIDHGVLSLEQKAVVVVKDRRTPGAYTAWRPDRFASVIDFRKLSGSRVVFKHVTGFVAVVKGESAEDVATYVLQELEC